MNLRDVVRPVGADASPDEWVMPVVIYPSTVIDDGSDDTPIQVVDAVATDATLSNVNGSASSVTLLAANTDRRGLLLVNDSTATLYLKYGATASTTSYSVKMEPGSYWEMPRPIYTGRIDGIWSAANGAARITELS